MTTSNNTYEQTVRQLDPRKVATVDEILSGVRSPGKRALVIDGTGMWEGVGTAEFLANTGTEVWVITDQFSVGSSLEGANRELFYQRAKSKSIHLIPTTRLVGEKDGALILAHAYTSEKTELHDIDLVVPAIGRRSDDDLYLDWMSRKEGIEVYRIGDCVAPRLLRDIINEAYEFAFRF